MGKLKKKFNWKARQNLQGQANSLEDTNPLVILPKKDKDDSELETTVVRRSKLNSKQKKRLQKVLMIKEQKAKHKALIESLQKMALPEKEKVHLIPSTSLSRMKLMKRNVEENSKRGTCPITKENIGLTLKRKVRKRRKLRVEKIQIPREIVSVTSSDDNDESSEDVISTPSLLDAVTEHQQSNSNIYNNKESKNEVPKCTTSYTLSHTETKQTLESTVASDDSKVKTEISETSNTTEEPTDTKSSSCNICLKNVPVKRSKNIQMARSDLPIISEEHSVMEAITEHDVIVLCGETGSGKTTQVPQFLYEGGYAHYSKDRERVIGVTEPRRIAAITMSQRVAEEMSLSNDEVSYQIRYEGCVSEKTKIKFMTDGVLLKEIEQDFLLLRYSVIVVDEAHERSVFTDILIGLLSRIVPQRRKMGDPLKLVIMSATLRVDDFIGNKALFPVPAPPVVSIESRQFPVTVHFNRHTQSDYVSAAYKKVCKIHTQLPPGHILVFVTGRGEVVSLCNRLRKTFTSSKPSNVEQAHEMVDGKDSDIDGDSSDQEVYDDVSEWAKDVKRKRKFNSKTTTHSKKFKKNNKNIDINLDNFPTVPSNQFTVQIDEGEVDHEDDLALCSDHDDTDLIQGGSSTPMIVYPLYSMLSPEKQSEVFRVHTEDTRVCVIATNVAETSVTIPGVKYVVDTGKVKQKHYDKVTEASTFKIDWISKASANQRAGRAGRTGPGHCYRLYSSTVYQHEFPDHTPPEISNRPLSDLVLQMKAMNIHKVGNFPFPTPPSTEAIQVAENLLVQLGALEKESKMITPLGRTLSHFPISPRYSKMLCLSNQHGCLPYMVSIVSALSVRELFVNETSTSEISGGFKRKWAGQGECYLLGDLMILLRAVCAYECAHDKESFCKQHGVRSKGIMEVRKLRQQLTNIINTVCDDADCYINPKLPPPTQHQAKILRQLVLTGHGDHVVRKLSTSEMNTEDKKKFKYAYESPLSVSPVYLHPSSILRSSCPDYVVFQELIETNKLFMKEVCAVEGVWLPVVLPELCTFSHPLDTPPPRYDPVSDNVVCHMESSFGSWSIGSQELPYPSDNSIDKYKYFTKSLLEGKVITELSQFTDHLLTPPIVMTKSWRKLHKRTDILLSSLVAKKVSSKQSLIQIWTDDDPKFLLSAYSKWLPESMHGTLLDIWPPVNQPS